MTIIDVNFVDLWAAMKSWPEALGVWTRSGTEDSTVEAGVEAATGFKISSSLQGRPPMQTDGLLVMII